MGFYQDQIVPLLINLAMRRRDLAAYRSRVVPAADSRVLEIGVGSGLIFIRAVWNASSGLIPRQSYSPCYGEI
jgi:hypothetical protein